MSKEVKLNYPALRRALINRGVTLASWARKHGYRPSTVYDSAKGFRNGILATRIRAELLEVVRD